MTPYSAAADGSFSSRESSRRAAFSTCSGRFFSSSWPRSSLISACCSSPSPSSSWMAFSCCRRKNSRWPLSISLATCDWIFEPSSDISTSRLRISETARSRSSTLTSLEQLLPLVGLQAERRRDQVAERARIVDVGGRELELLGQVRRHADDVRELLLHVPCQRLDLGRVGDDVRQVLELGDEVRVVLLRLDQPNPLQPLDEDAQRPVGHLDHLVNDRDRADRVQVVPARRVGLGVAHGHQREHPLARDDVVDQPDRALLADGERRHRLREDHRLLQRQDRQRASARRPRWACPRSSVPADDDRDGTAARGLASAIGSVMRSIPASYVAVADEAATSWPSGIRRSKCPYSISACW